MTKQPEALRLADIVERLNVGVHSQAIAEEYSAAAAELRRLHERDVKADAQIKELLQIIEDFEHHTELLRQRVNELEEQLSAAQQGVRVPLSDELPQGFLSDVLTAAGLVSHGKQGGV